MPRNNYFKTLIIGALLLSTTAGMAEDNVMTGNHTQTISQTETEPTAWEKALARLPKISGYLQTGWNYNSQGKGSNSFQAKRLRLLMDGKVTDNVTFRLQVEAFNGIAGSTNGNGQKNLQVMDAFMTAKVKDYFQVRAGQYFLPLGYENYDISPATLETIDFSNVCYRMVCRNPISYGFVDYGRDLGVMIFGDLLPNVEEGFNHLTYNLSLTNGQLPAKDDNNQSKDVVAALTVRPIKYMNLKASYNYGCYDGTVNEVKYKNQPMQRMILGAWYNDPQGLDLRAEYGHISSTKANKSVLDEHGGYVLLGWHAGQFLPVVRYDLYRDKVNDGTINNYDRTLVGLSYTPCKNFKLQANYAYTVYTDKAQKASNGGKKDSSQIQLMGVFSF